MFLNNRESISSNSIAEAADKVGSEMSRRLQEKGFGSFASTHEIAGVIHEEFNELMNALRENDAEQFQKELYDIAVGCIFGAACINEASVSEKA